MRLEFKLPDVGEGIAEAEIVEYLVKPGDRVKADQNVVRIETDKAMVELPAPESGIIVEVPHKPGDTLKVGDVILVIETGLSAPAPSAAADARVLATPHTRKLARELGVEIDAVKATGPHDRVSDEDVRAAAVPSAAALSLPEPGPPATDVRPPASTDRRVPLKGIRKKTAEAMAKSWAAIPHVTHGDEADVTALFDFVGREKAAALKDGVKLTPLAFVFKAALGALKKHPSFNASLDDEKGELVYKDCFNFGFAADTPSGLMVPVIRDVDRKSIVAIAAELQTLGAKARDRTITVGELRGGTFTVTNIGSIGGTHATPIIIHPQVAILALMRAQKKPVVRDGAVVIRTVMPVDLSFDHRVIDGAEAARFVNMLVGFLEDPMKLLLQE